MPEDTCGHTCESVWTGFDKMEAYLFRETGKWTDVKNALYVDWPLNSRISSIIVKNAHVPGNRYHHVNWKWQWRNGYIKRTAIQSD